MIPPNVLVAGALVLGAAGLVMSAGMPLSLANDVGLADADVCASVDAYGPTAAERLDAAGFPHAAPGEPRERYRLTRMDEVKAFIEIDWVNKNAFCLPLDPTLPYTASVTMTGAAYDSLVGELRSVIETGQATGRVVNYGVIWFGTDIATPRSAHDHAYERELARWAVNMRGEMA